jgi:hypothetical protein
VGQGFQAACAGVKRMDMMGRPYQVVGPLCIDRAIGREFLVYVTVHATCAKKMDSRLVSTLEHTAIGIYLSKWRYEPLTNV